MSLAKELINRGFINQISADNLEKITDGEKRTIYHGIDPSANSAHAGNFVLWMLLKHLANAGHRIIFLVGGGTGMIGDPKPDTERELKTQDQIEGNVAGLRKQAEKFFSDKSEVEFVNNYDWLSSLTMIDFLRDVGKHFTVNELIKKDAIATRLQSDNGLSYTEFAYPLLQGYDFYQLHKTKGCTVQVGGSDQWGNIIAGVELVRRKSQSEVFALTVPLIIDKATGKKFGKSEGNAVWLDENQTSPFTFYQFWLNTSDESVVDFLKLFTFLNLATIEEIRLDFETNPGHRSAQKKLAYEVTKIVHGEDLADSAEKVSSMIFSGVETTSLSDTEVEMMLETAPSSVINSPTNIIEVLVDSGLATSKREAKTFVEGGAVEVLGEKVSSIDYLIEPEKALGGLIIIKRGKKQIHLLKTN